MDDAWPWEDLRLRCQACRLSAVGPSDALPLEYETESRHLPPLPPPGTVLGTSKKRKVQVTVSCKIRPQREGTTAVPILFLAVLLHPLGLPVSPTPQLLWVEALISGL